MRYLRGNGRYFQVEGANVSAVANRADQDAGEGLRAACKALSNTCWLIVIGGYTVTTMINGITGEHPQWYDKCLVVYQQTWGLTNMDVPQQVYAN